MKLVEIGQFYSLRTRGLELVTDVKYGVLRLDRRGIKASREGGFVTVRKECDKGGRFHTRLCIDVQKEGKNRVGEKISTRFGKRKGSYPVLWPVLYNTSS